MPNAEMEVILEVEEGELEAQLNRLLDSHHFRHSHRYPSLLRYLVEQTRLGNSHLLKERLLGIEVFRRAPDYDTNVDPVVRVTAAEVRKRIAQYYQESGHESELRIELPTGSYVPRFHRPAPFTVPEGRQPESRPSAEPVDIPAVAAKPAASEHELPDSQELPQAPVAPSTPEKLARPFTLQWRRLTASPWLAILLLALGALAVLAVYQLPDLLLAHRERALRALWAPIANSDGPVFAVVGDHTVGMKGNALRAAQGLPANPAEAVLQEMNEREQVTFSDMQSLFGLINYMTRHALPYRAQGAGAVDIAGLRNGPVLLFAGLDNRWTMRLATHLRYQFVDNEDDAIGTIADANVPGRAWTVDFNVPVIRQPTDYALVARYFDSTIEQPVLLVAGVGATGTTSATEFVTSERMLEDVFRTAPKGWNPQTGNMELVLATQVMDGRGGPPHVVASQFW